MKNTNNTLQKTISDTLQKRYNKTCLTIKELSDELDCSISLINSFIARGFLIPESKTPQTVKVFSIASVASFLSQSV